MTRSRGIAWFRAVNGAWRARRGDTLTGEIKIYWLRVVEGDDTEPLG